MGRFKKVTFYVSGASVPGEGELKCIDWVKLMGLSGEDSVVLIGGDADLVLQGMALSQVCTVHGLLNEYAYYASMHAWIAIAGFTSAIRGACQLSVHSFELRYCLLR